MIVERASAEVWAAWFRALGDATRVLLLNRLAVAKAPMTVGELVEVSDVGQSTVSHHLRVLAEAGFVLSEQQGASNRYRVNERCLECFPSAAELVMGHLPRYPVADTSPCTPPWLEPSDAQPRRPTRRASRPRPRSTT
jgi:DNA-binding transcriptional ArsR family regulator